MAIIIDGKKVGHEIKGNLLIKVQDIKQKYGYVPGLAVILVGSDPASSVYVRMKRKGCEDVGMESFQYLLPETTSETELLDLITQLNHDKRVSGILVQLPLPEHIHEFSILNAIDPLKDVDGFHPINMGKMVNGDACLLPCTPLGIQALINRYAGSIKGKHLVMLGRSSIVGKPTANIMLQKNECANCIVTICHSAAPEISIYTLQADILVVGVGKPNTVTGDMVKEGVIVIDVGVNRVADPNDASKSFIVGDVDYESVAKKAYAITPVPGGVGPMTIAMLLSNTVKAFELQRKEEEI